MSDDDGYPSTDDCNSSLKEPNVKEQRRNEKALMKSADYREYIAQPFYVQEDSKGKQQIAFADMSQEMMSCARLLPSHPSNYKDKFPQDASRIKRSKFLGKDSRLPIWWFKANCSKDNLTFKFYLKEIDVYGIHGDGNGNDVDISQAGSNKLFEGSEKLMKELYLLHYFKHENLLHAYFTRSEPNIFRMNIALPRTIPLLKISTLFNLKETWSTCPSMPYVAICIIRALAYLHTCRIAHRNVSIENCLVDVNGNVVLGGFSNAGPLNEVEEAGNDIWNVATTILDFVLGTVEYGIDFPDPSCIDGYDSLVDKMVNCQSKTWSANNNNAPVPKPDARFVTSRLGYIRDVISRYSQLSQFLELILQAQNRPNANFLLQFYRYTAVEEKQFKRLKNDFLQKCLQFDELKIQPFCRDRKVSTYLQSVNPRQVSNVFKSKSKPLEGDIPDSEYRYSISNHYREIKSGTLIDVAFQFHSDIFNPPNKFYSSFVVDSETSLFHFLCSSINAFEIDSTLLAPKNESQYCDLPNCPGQVFFPWDIFRLRTAILSMLPELANGSKNTEMIDKHLVTKHQFVLCNHPEKAYRLVIIELKCSPTRIVDVMK